MIDMKEPMIFILFQLFQSRNLTQQSSVLRDKEIIL